MLGMILSKLEAWYSVLSPSLAAIASASSTSHPMGLPASSLYSLGAYDGSMPMMSLPASLIFAGSRATAAASTPTLTEGPSSLGAVLLSTQPLRASAATAATASTEYLMRIASSYLSLGGDAAIYTPGSHEVERDLSDATSLSRR